MSMTCLLDRICERAPVLAASLLRLRPGGDGQDCEPVVLIADPLIPRAAAALRDGTALALPYRSPPWPVTFIELGRPAGIPDVADGLPVVSTIGWLLAREPDYGAGS